MHSPDAYAEPSFLDTAKDYKDLAVGVGWIVTMIGWLVSNHAATKREKRKEVRSEIDACAKMAYEILSWSRDYFGKPASDESCTLLAAKIRFELQRLFLRTERLEGRFPEFELHGATGELLDSITGGEFDSSERGAIKADSPELLKVEADIHHLIEQLENGFARAF